MKKTHLRRGISMLAIALFLSLIASCEKDFTDIGSEIINNSKFSTNDITLEVEVITGQDQDIEAVRADNIQLGVLGQYLLGVYNNENYEKIEASIVSQIGITTSLEVADLEDYTNVTELVTQIDTIFLKLPYQATASSDGTLEIDSVIGNPEVAFNLNVYRISTFLNRLNPSNPAQNNSYQSNYVYNKVPGELNAQSDFEFKPNKNDTSIVIKRRANGAIYGRDTIKYTAGSNSTTPIPFARIPLKEDLMKSILLDEYQGPNFSSQDAFNEYFRGILLEASGDDGSLISFDFSNSNTLLSPSIEVYYTNIISHDAGIDTVKVNHSFPLSIIVNNRSTLVTNSIYKMTPRVASSVNNFPIQGTAGSTGLIQLFGPDNNGNNIPDEIEELRTRDWLINDASLTFYVDQDASRNDSVPYRLFLYKEGEINLTTVSSQIDDAFLPNDKNGRSPLGGYLEQVDDEPDKYTFNITRYVSRLLRGETNYVPPLVLKVYNPTDTPTNSIDTIVDTYNWNPKGVMLLNNLLQNGDRRPQLKISYSEKLTD